MLFCLFDNYILDTRLVRACAEKVYYFQSAIPIQLEIPLNIGTQPINDGTSTPSFPPTNENSHPTTNADDDVSFDAYSDAYSDNDFDAYSDASFDAYSDAPFDNDLGSVDSTFDVDSKFDVGENRDVSTSNRIMLEELDHLLSTDENDYNFGTEWFTHNLLAESSLAVDVPLSALANDELTEIMVEYELELAWACGIQCEDVAMFCKIKYKWKEFGSNLDDLMDARGGGKDELLLSRELNMKQ